VIKEALGRVEETPEIAAGKLEIPDDLFECITGYEDVKEVGFLRKYRKGT